MIGSSVLRKKLQNIKPQHDTPIGILHPYWARKPLNVIDAIIQGLSNKGDVVLDPFVGSGTTAYSAVANKRKVVASDLSPLSFFLTKSSLELSNLCEEDLDKVLLFFDEVFEDIKPWYVCNSDYIIERERYCVAGQYANGKFTLNLSEIVAKKIIKSKYTGRTVFTPKDIDLKGLKGINKYLNSPIDFHEHLLLKNSRIAIPEGARLSHYFTKKNRASINLMMAKLSKSRLNKKIKDAIRLLISSSLPLLRLSDKKASSQWPYWRPKNELTSRNPIFVLRKKLKKFHEAVHWSQEELGILNIGSTPDKVIKNKESNQAAIFSSAVQDISNHGVNKNSVDLILTDPPYSDHAPYLEYSNLWNKILKLSSNKKLYRKEIVKTDCPERIQDTNQYLIRLEKGISTCCEVLKSNGYFAFFYQDKEIIHWAEIGNCLTDNGMTIEDVIPIPKQRRSMKTVASPGKTFDGDLLVVCVKKKNKIRNTKYNIEEELVRIQNNFTEKTSYFEKYAVIIREGLVSGWLDELSKKYKYSSELFD